MSTQISTESAAPGPSLRLPRELLKNTAFLVARLGYGFKARAIAAVEEAGFSLYDYSVLALLAEEPRKAQATIADALMLDRSQLVGILDGLEDRGLVERKRDPIDRRRHLVSLTADGRTQLGRLRTIITEVQEELLAPLDEKSRETLHALVLQLTRHHYPGCVGTNGA